MYNSKLGAAVDSIEGRNLTEKSWQIQVLPTQKFQSQISIDNLEFCHHETKLNHRWLAIEKSPMANFEREAEAWGYPEPYDAI